MLYYTIIIKCQSRAASPQWRCLYSSNYYIQLVLQIEDCLIDDDTNWFNHLFTHTISGQDVFWKLGTLCIGTPERLINIVHVQHTYS
jgi:hypothetical protein